MSRPAAFSQRHRSHAKPCVWHNPHEGKQKSGSPGNCVGNWIHGLAWGWRLRASRSDPSGLLQAESFWNSRGQARRRAWCRGQFQRSSPDQSRWGPAPRAKSAPTPCQASRDPHDSLMSRIFYYHKNRTYLKIEGRCPERVQTCDTEKPRHVFSARLDPFRCARLGVEIPISLKIDFEIGSRDRENGTKHFACGGSQSPI